MNPTLNLLASRSVALALCAATAILALPAMARQTSPGSPMPGTAVASAPARPLVTGLPDFTDLIDKAGPAVVNIRTTARARRAVTTAEEEEIMEYLRRYYGMPIPRQAPRGRTPQPAQPEAQVPRGIGSGFIISSDGYVLTNAHVIEDADTVFVTLNDRREFKARVLGADKRTDVALLKLEAANLPRLLIGDSGKIRVGEWVIAIGSPFNLDNTVTAGIISAKSRDTGDFLPLIQSDVAVNPGNSGGPLINMRGEVIGINSQIWSPSGSYAGISFAVPIDEVMRISDQLRASGKVTRGRIGVEFGDVSKEVAASQGLGRARGVAVARVEPGGPADKAGVKAGDIILKFNGAPIERSSELPRFVAAAPVGSQALVTVWRKGSQQDIALTVVALNEEAAPKAPVRPRSTRPRQ